MEGLMTEDEIKSEMRLWALECIVCQHWATALIALPQSMADEVHKQLLDGAKKNAFPKIDPALSDHYAAEFESALQRLVKMQRDYMAVGKSKS
jgi:hypothetical protein